MILLLALLQSVAGPPADASLTQQRYENCVALATRSPVEGASEAGAWRVVGGGYLARQCLGIAYANQQRWLPAATAFEQAAREAEVAKDGRAASFWAQAGNALLAGGEADKARTALNAAVALNVLTGLELGEVHLDRARALVAAGDTAGARADLDKATDARRRRSARLAAVGDAGAAHGRPAARRKGHRQGDGAVGRRCAGAAGGGQYRREQGRRDRRAHRSGTPRSSTRRTAMRPNPPAPRWRNSPPRPHPDGAGIAASCALSSRA